MKIAFPDMIEEFWLYEYHKTNYSYCSGIFEYIGGVNRDKYIPSFLKDIVAPNIYNKYISLREHTRFKVLGDMKPYTET